MRSLDLGDVLAWRAARWAERPAVRCPDAGAELSYAALWRAGTWLADELGAAGVRSGDRVAGRTGNGVETVAAVAACHRLGAVWVPLNTRLSEREMADIIADCEPRVVVHDDQHGPIGLPLPAPQRRVAAEAVLAAAARSAPVENAAAGAAGGAGEAGPSRRPAYILYTSGSTGRPKGVVLDHAAVLENTRRMGLELGVRQGDVCLQPLPVYHVGGLATLWIYLYAGGLVVLPRRYDAAVAVEAARRLGRVTLMEVPTTLARLLDALEREGVPEGLERVLYSGSPPSRALLERAAAILGRRLVQVYGLTETAPTLTMLQGEEHLDPSLLGSCGRPLRDIFVEIRDANGSPQPQGALGEIAVRTPAVMSGYWRQPEQTAAVLRDGWLLTGDSGYLGPAGHLFIVGRKKDMVISGAENIYPREVEDVLSTHPDVREVAVTGVPDAEWGEVVLAAVVLRPRGAEGGKPAARPAGAAAAPAGDPGASAAAAVITAGTSLDGSAAAAAAAELERHCLESLARYKRPRRWLFLDELPRLETGKIDKRRIQALFGATPAAVGAAPGGGERRSEPVETDVVAIVRSWHEALNTGDVERLVALCAEDVELGGPCGGGHGAGLLREWFGRAGIRLTPRAMYRRGGTVLVEQEAVWQDAAAAEAGPSQAVASVFTVRDGLVASVVRHPDLAAARLASGLGPEDRV